MLTCLYRSPVVKIKPSRTMVGQPVGTKVATFSSRGPNSISPAILKVCLIFYFFCEVYRGILASTEVVQTIHVLSHVGPLFLAMPKCYFLVARIRTQVAEFTAVNPLPTVLEALIRNHCLLIMQSPHDLFRILISLQDREPLPVDHICFYYFRSNTLNSRVLNGCVTEKVIQLW